jgi:hypothetical protein
MAKFLTLLIISTVISLSTYLGDAQASTILPATGSSSFSSVDQPHFLGAVSTVNGCTHFMFRQLTSTSWSSAGRVRPGCISGSVGQPVLVRDRSNGRLFIVWSKTNILKRASSGVYSVTSTNNGRTWSVPHQVVSLPAALLPVPVAAAAGNGRLWVAYQLAPGSRHSVVYGLLQAPFALYRINEQTNRLLTQNLTNAHIYTADDSQSSFKMFSSAQGIILVWDLTDAGGNTHAFVLQATSNSVRFDGAWDTKFPGTPTITAGENNSIYLMTEDRGSLTAILSAYRFSFSAHTWVPLPGGAVWAVLHLGVQPNPDLLSPRLALAFQVSASGTAYMTYLDYNSYGNFATTLCFTGTYLCSRAVEPMVAPPQVFTISRTPADKITTFALPFTYPRYPSGNSTVVWALYGSGLDQLTSRLGSMRYLMWEGWQNETASGSFSSAINYEFIPSPAL